MGIGGDIKETFADVGVGFTIFRDAGNISGEYLTFELNRQVTKPFIREYFLEASISYDTDVIGGDVIQFDTDDRCFLVMNRTPEEFENEIVNYEAVLYKCNVSGELKRFSGEGWDAQTYQFRTQWDTVKSNCYGLITEKLFGTDLLQDEELGQIGIDKNIIYLPHSIGTQVFDRYEFVSGEYYKIEIVETRKFDGVDVCHLAEDTRE